MKKYLIIINPKAGKGKGLKASPAIRNFVESRNIEHSIIFSDYHGHIPQIVKNNANEYSHIIAVGGDGTVNEVINGLDLSQNKKLAVIPIGSGNDFARNLKLSKNLNDTLEHTFGQNPRIKSFDVGQITFSEHSGNEKKNHRFVNSLGVGFDALVADLNQNSKVFSGIVSYVIAVLRALQKYHIMDVKIQLDGRVIEGKKLLISVGNGYTTGGGFYLTPKAKIDDKQLDICIIDKISKLKLLRSLPKALINKLENVPEALMLLFNELKMTLEEPYIAHADGEIISKDIKELEISLIPNQVQVICNNI